MVAGLACLLFVSHSPPSTKAEMPFKAGDGAAANEPAVKDDANKTAPHFTMTVVYKFAIIAGLAGVFVLWSLSVWNKTGVFYKILHELGMALIVSAIVIATVEGTLRVYEQKEEAARKLAHEKNVKEIESNVFKYLLGHDFPPVINDEIHASVYAPHLLRQGFDVTYLFRSQDKESGLLTLITRVEYEIRNLSTNPGKWAFRPSFADVSGDPQNPGKFLRFLVEDLTDKGKDKKFIVAWSADGLVDISRNARQQKLIRLPSDAVQMRQVFPKVMLVGIPEQTIPARITHSKAGSPSNTWRVSFEYERRVPAFGTVTLSTTLPTEGMNITVECDNPGLFFFLDASHRLSPPEEAVALQGASVNKDKNVPTQSRRFWRFKVGLLPGHGIILHWWPHPKKGG